MVNEIHQIVVKYEIPSQNVRDRWHWTVRRRDRQAATLAVRAALMRAGLSAWRPPEGKVIALTLTSYRRQAIKDHANLVGGAKTLVDVLVNLGLLEDDSDEHVVIIYDQGPLRLSPLVPMAACTAIRWEVPA